MCKLNRTGKPVIPLNWSSMLHFINSCIHFLVFRTAFTMLSETMGQLIESEQEQNPGQSVEEQVASLNRKYEMHEDLICWAHVFENQKMLVIEPHHMHHI